ncbi:MULTISPECIES: hypothetical protein [unclassified Cupriavidus]|uniref:hypothetical protein n=1 Tax=unclassified Cupriavidus TaxID=2640874 RepID=UPI001C0020BB|nr:MULTISPECIES: hypothetical protein [unclassified Cupriavidus]MCA3194593.1 hypothetical protein [Cupriavidus sp.]MCA3199936.1 hypothetical protein [Cupriavidus sp.]MCA3205552.1 hypothetical protein [Cupriavidus sp.]MCA3205946.1 hypothetical protein [Cupriavidus sp.]MCA3232494.1 hypothetical protein [Cupriavidus sp.]
MDALNTTLARLSRHAMQCAEALAAVAAAASDPQIRAVLAHRANMQRCASAELASRAGAAGDGPEGAATGRARDPQYVSPPAETGELPLLRHAAQQAGRAAAAYGELLREPLDDAELRLLLAHYYRGATELQRLLEQRAMEFTPARSPGAGARRMVPRVH